MTAWHNLRKWSLRRFTVTLDWCWEEYPDLSWDETGETQARVESGELGVFTFRVMVCLDGDEIGRDYLGNSIYADPAKFAGEHIAAGKHRRETGQTCGAYVSDMVREAVREARRHICRVPAVRCHA